MSAGETSGGDQTGSGTKPMPAFGWQSLAMEFLFRHGPWCALFFWTLSVGGPALVDRIQNGYSELQRRYEQSLDNLQDRNERAVDRLVTALENSTQESRSLSQEIRAVVAQREKDRAAMAQQGK